MHTRRYLGDGTYGDGLRLAWDGYNDFVIQPFLIAITRALGVAAPVHFAAQVLTRAKRHAIVRERFIGLDGTYPLLGRSACYRFGAFQGLADLALREALPSELPPGQVRAALTAVLRRQLEMADTFDEAGGLRIGFAGAQPSLAEFYIATGSLYLCMALFLPLGPAASICAWPCSCRSGCRRRRHSGVHRSYRGPRSMPGAGSICPATTRSRIDQRGHAARPHRRPPKGPRELRYSPGP